MPIKRKPTAKKKAAKKTARKRPAINGLKKYIGAMKKGTASITKRIKEQEKKLAALKKAKKQKITLLTKKYRKK